MNETSPEPTTFAEVNERLARIADEVHDKDLSLEKSLDLYEEAVRLSNDALLLIQKPIFSPEESATLTELRSSDPLEEGSAVSGDVPPTTSGVQREPGTESQVPQASGTDVQVEPGTESQASQTSGTDSQVEPGTESESRAESETEPGSGDSSGAEDSPRTETGR
ncbi:MAG: exodeoxyribonuclease VII small subunit [Actinomycetota bacterium]|nr:exodeoxyribonuclease VII small subunit [Actinomycetota bacterium]